MGPGHPDAAARRRRQRSGRASDLQGASAAGHDDLSPVPVYAAGSRLECAGLVSRPARLSGRPQPQQRPRRTPDSTRGVVMDCSVTNALPKPKTITVNGTVIPREVIAREVQNHPAEKPILAWQAAARALVVREFGEQRRISPDRSK